MALPYPTAPTHIIASNQGFPVKLALLVQELQNCNHQLQKY
jgi:hypothetical protein